MPVVGNVKYPYTKKGRQAAAAAKNKNGKGGKVTKVAKKNLYRKKAARRA
jgi:hypothetical protein|tara:strand:- start:154 stop:303 length:150 start_codon:yes stop_codon:yes gene_type:complete